jgi:predicted nucleic acid-binding Zn ribbon protein
LTRGRPPDDPAGVATMPIYEYVSEHPDDPERSCRICARGFELRRPVTRPPLLVCPLCRHPVRKLPSRVNTPHLTKPLSVSDAKRAGFTVLERRDQGVYEKL